ncbi:MAG: hypothetical protein RIC55_07210 [Pirellulaceae bacterium]
MTNQTTDAANCAKDAAELFDLTRLRVATLQSAELLWKRGFTRHERAQLGNSFAEAMENHQSGVGMWMLLRRVSYQRAVIEVGRTLGFLDDENAGYLLREAGEIPRDPEEAQSEAIARGDLVIDRASQSVYWNCELLAVDWQRHNESLQFLVLACEHALRNESIDRLSFGDGARANIVTQKKSRLKCVPGFPSDLIEFFKVKGRGTQRFTLSPKRIHIF